MKKNVPHNLSDKNSKVKEISDGVYINLNRITSDEQDFEQAIEESFKKSEEKQSIENLKDNSEKTKSPN
ncbi:hypothetical protein [Flavobacterium sp. SM2513]|uniref:hypothetical protein n=1 Tax=Flavobacterium sp. SM2513 TaxID=3424766 RepID=UPI003D7FE103